MLIVCIDDSQRTVNVLLIGESGVGKSTWINAFANYCLYDSLDVAVKDGGIFPIPFNFTMTDPQTKRQITVSSDDRLLASTKITKAGESITQNPSEYVFRHAHTAIKLIDTPGLLDTNDVGKPTHDTDKEHVNNILKVLSAYQEIHAIFVLMKANVTRLSHAFQYTLTEIFKRLDKKACNNVIFIFTNATSSNFKPDETQPILQRFLEDQNLPIALPPEKPTIYCFESDTMKYIAKCKNGIPHDEDDEENAQKSWRKSVKSTKELLGYICSLEPHSLAVMMSINKATNMVSMVSKLLLDTIMCIFKDVDEMEDKKNAAEYMRENIRKDPEKFANDELKSLLHVTETTLVHEKLGYTNVVCESGHCSKVEKGQIIYPQVCCKQCTRSEYMMYFCSSITWGGSCSKCGCNKSQHGWKTTETKVITVSVYRPDDAVINSIVDGNEALKHIEEGLSQFESQVKKCKAEAQEMIEICAKLNAFAHENASFRESTDDELLKCLENKRQTYAMSTDTRREANDLEKIKSTYLQELSKAENLHYSVEEVPKLIEQLYKLKMKGHEIMMAIEENEKSRLMIIEKSKKTKRDIIIEGFSAIASCLR